MKIIHTVPSLATKDGGPSRTVTQLTGALSERNSIEITLVSQRFKKENIVKGDDNQVIHHCVDVNSRLRYSAGVNFFSKLSKLCASKDYTIMHVHGVWLPVNILSIIIAKFYKIPYVIQPRGMLEPWALANKSWKKKISLLIYQRRLLEGASMLVATSYMEYQNLRSLGLINPVAIIPNGIAHRQSEDQEPLTGSKFKKALFLSRIHPKKGLMNLLQAWARLNLTDWRLQLAGPNENNHLEKVMHEAKRLGIEDNIEYLGELEGKSKDSAYRRADIFVLPTFSENFGVVIAEALSYGLPVVTTKGAPWEELTKYKCGWWVDIGVNPLVEALKEATELSDSERHKMGINGKLYVKRYNWPSLAEQMHQAYGWLLKIENKPCFVKLD